MDFLRITRPEMMQLIPDQLYELDDDTFSAERFKEMFPQMIQSPVTYMIAMTDEGRIVGIYWAAHNKLSNRLVVFGMSLLPEYQKQDRSNIDMFKSLSREIVEANGYDKVVELYSNHPKIAERYGLTKARIEIYEWDIQTLSGESGAESLGKAIQK